MDTSLEDWCVTNNNDFSASAREKMVTCNSEARRLLQIGLDHWLDEKHKKPFSGVKRIIYMVPGNPGEVLFYKDTMEILHRQLALPVIGISHGGLSRRCQRLKPGPLTVRKLVEDEIDFIEEFVPRDVEIILIGHSIGSFIAKEMMKVAEDRERFIHAVLTMPALQDLAGSAGGRILRFLRFASFLLYFCIFLLWLLPDQFISMIARAGLRLLFDDFAECSVAGAVELTHVPTVRNALTLARDEFNQVQDLDERFIGKNLQRLSFVYAEADEWVRRSNYDDLKKRFPEANAVIVPRSLHCYFFSKRMTDDVLQVICKTLNQFKEPESKLSVKF